MQHTTTTPEQAQTDEWAVFGDQSAQLDSNQDLALIKRVEVPQYARPESGAVKLSFDKRLALAVTYAVTATDTSPDSEMSLGEDFMVMHDLEKPMEVVPYEGGATHGAIPAGVWNPNTESL